MILIDTSVLIDLTKNEADDTVKSHVDAQLCAISVITHAEARLGFLLAAKNLADPQRELFKHFLSVYQITILPVEQQVANANVRIQRTLMQIGQKLSPFDALIAATALTHNLPLLTSDRDFSRVPGLKLLS